MKTQSAKRMTANNRQGIERQAHKMLRIGIYVRESRDDYGENVETIETQRDLLINYAESNDLGVVESVYIDNNVSGTEFDRYGLNKLKRDVDNNLIDIVLIKDLSRLGRNNARTLELLDYFEEHGVRVITYDGKFDSLRDNDTVGIDTWYNERYVRDISRKTRASLKFKIKNGEYIGTAPYGYKKSQIKKNVLVIDETQAPVIRQIYKCYIEGMGYAAIARYLDKLGYSPPGNSGRNISGRWNPVTVKRILENRVYIGDTVQGISEKINFKSKKTRRLPQEKWTITENTHPAIISREIFDRVNQIRMSKRHKDPINYMRHTYSGVMFCGNCGMLMYARKRKGRPMGYICSKYAKNGAVACKSHFVRESDINEAVKQDILCFFKNEKLISEVEDKLTGYFIEIKDKDKYLSECRSRLKRKEKQQEMLYMDMLENKITFDLFSRINKNIENEIRILRNFLEQNNKKDSKQETAYELINKAREYIENGILTGSIIKCLIDKIIVYEINDMKGRDFGGINDKIDEFKDKWDLVIEIQYKF
mgnify:FL=1